MTEVEVEDRGAAGGGLGAAAKLAHKLSRPGPGGSSRLFSSDYVEWQSKNSRRLRAANYFLPAFFLVAFFFGERAAFLAPAFFLAAISITPQARAPRVEQISG